MYHTIEKMQITIDEKQGYAFMDREGNCILITYGETMRKNWVKILNK